MGCLILQRAGKWFTEGEMETRVHNRSQRSSQAQSSSLEKKQKQDPKNKKHKDTLLVAEAARLPQESSRQLPGEEREFPLILKYRFLMMLNDPQVHQAATQKHNSTPEGEENRPRPHNPRKHPSNVSIHVLCFLCYLL